MLQLALTIWPSTMFYFFAMKSNQGHEAALYCGTSNQNINNPKLPITQFCTVTLDTLPTELTRPQNITFEQICQVSLLLLIKIHLQSTSGTLSSHIAEWHYYTDLLHYPFLYLGYKLYYMYNILSGTKHFLWILWWLIISQVILMRESLVHIDIPEHIQLIPSKYQVWAMEPFHCLSRGGSLF